MLETILSPYYLRTYCDSVFRTLGVEKEDIVDLSKQANN